MAEGSQHPGQLPETPLPCLWGEERVRVGCDRPAPLHTYSAPGPSRGAKHHPQYTDEEREAWGSGLLCHAIQRRGGKMWPHVHLSRQRWSLKGTLGGQASHLVTSRRRRLQQAWAERCSGDLHRQPPEDGVGLALPLFPAVQEQASQHAAGRSALQAGWDWRPGPLWRCLEWHKEVVPPGFISWFCCLLACFLSPCGLLFLPIDYCSGPGLCHLLFGLLPRSPCVSLCPFLPSPIQTPWYRQ